MMIDWFAAWYIWWLGFWSDHPVIFVMSAVVTIGFTVYVRRRNRRNR